jgi:hypothetical protein
MAQERAVFERFLVSYASFARDVSGFTQPDPWPDIQALLQSGKKQDIELVEWIDGKQLAAAAGTLECSPIFCSPRGA